MKHYILLAIYLVFTNFFSSAQNQQKLEQQLQAAKTDQNKIYALYELADYYTYTLGKDSIADLCGDKQIALANQSGNKELIALGYYLEGERLIQTVPSEKRFRRAKDCLYRTIQISVQNNLPFYEAAAYIALSRPYYVGFEIDGDKALELGDNALKLSTSIANDSLLSLSLVSISIAYRYKNDYTNAYRKLQGALQVAERLDNPYLLAYSYRALGLFYRSLGESNKSLSNFLKAEQSMERKKSPTHNELYWLYWIRKDISNVYADMKNEQKAKEYINKFSNQAKAFDMQEFFKLFPLLQQVFLQLNLDNFIEARKLYWNPEVEKIFLAVDYGFQYYHDRAFALQYAHQADSAAYYYQKSLAIEDNAQPSSLPRIYNHYASFLWGQNMPAKAIHYFALAEAKSKEFKDLNALSYIYHDLDSFYFKSGNIQKAYEYNKLYHRYNDTLVVLSQQKELALLEVEDEQKKMEQERLSEQAKAAYSNRMKNYALAGGLIGLFIVSGIFYYNNQQKQKAKQQFAKQKGIIDKQNALAEERLRIAADMHDDVGAGLSRIRYIAAAFRDSNQPGSANIDKILSLSDESVENMNEIIWSLNRGNQQLAELIYHVRSQCAEMAGNANINFACTMPEEIPAVILTGKEARNIYLLVKETVNNAIKHAAAKNITIVFEINQLLRITVKDDGKGFDETNIRKDGNGLLNYKKRVESMNGSYTLKTFPGIGTELNFVIPLPGK